MILPAPGLKGNIFSKRDTFTGWHEKKKKKMTNLIRVGSRGSRLALTQARQYLERLKAATADLEFEMVEIQTSGDRFGHLSPEKVMERSGKGIFVKEIEEAILDGRVDLAIHSLKDMPSEIPKGLVLAGYQEREDPRDAWVAQGKSLQEIPSGAKIGTSSPRRKCQLLELFRAMGKEVQILPLRGNVETRLRKVSEGELDAAVLSLAGLTRLGLEKQVSHYFDPELQMTPACGQGTLAAEIRADRSDLFEILAQAEDRQTRLASELERAVLKVMGGGCLEALGIYARPAAEEGSFELIVYQHQGADEDPGHRYTWTVTAQDSQDLLDKLLKR